LLARAVEFCRIGLDPAHRRPSATRVFAATIGSIIGSLAVDAVLVAIGVAIFPSTRGHAHFQFHYYAKLTVVGVILACLAWSVVTRLTSAPRWIFLRLAILVALVLLLPDLWILHQGQPPRAVAVLMLMHLAVALVSYNLLVHIAPVVRNPGPISDGPRGLQTVGSGDQCASGDR
jgi:thiol:disulfide interchange protein